MPFVAPKSTTVNNSSNGPSNAGGRTTFRPPWVKDDGGAAKTNSTVKTSVPWAKKTAAGTAAEKENGEKSVKPTDKSATTSTTSKKVSEPVAKKVVETPKKTNAEPSKKVVEPVKKTITPAKKIPEPVKKSVEPVKKPTPTSLANKKTTVASKKKEPTPSSSSSEEEEEEEETEEETEEEETEESEEETEEESEDEAADSDEEPDLPEEMKRLLRLKPTQTNKKKEEEPSELKQRFTIEKPKLRPVVVKRDKSMKKVEDEDDVGNDGNDVETEDERENKLRFKLEKPKLRHVKREEKPLPSKSTENILKIRPVLKKVSKVDELLKEPKEDPKPEFKTKTLRKTPSIKREPSIKNVPAPPPLPSLVPKAPPPPPPPLGAPADKRTLSETQKAVLEKLKTRPRRRPDWSEMMKEVETGRKLRHVECNDRSQPILTCKSMTKVDNKFIYETEKDNSHNKLLKQIQGGIKLRKTQTNDRSKPILEGLRKFRRQMTIEEQLQKSQSKINMLSEAPGGSTATTAAATTATGAPTAARGSIVSALSIDEGSADELDDIDKIRDDLQSTKQMLALELRNREAQERENKKLLAKIKTLEAELEREKSREKNLEYGSNVIVATMDPTPTTEQMYVNSLKREVEDARKTAKDVEKNYHDTSELLDEAKAEIEEQKRQIQLLERKLAHALQGGGSFDGSRRASDAYPGRDSSPELDLNLSESDPDEPEEKKNERRERRLGKEIKILRSKLTKLKVKQEAAKKEKDALKQAMKKNHVILKEENKKFKKLEKEVQKMAASLKLDDDDEDDEEKDEEEEPAEEEEASEEESEEESEESESEESEAETQSESEAEDATNACKKQNLEPRVKKHEGRLSAMKKCNVLLQANVDNLQDEITQVRTKAANLQAELNSVLQDLGL